MGTKFKLPKRRFSLVFISIYFIAITALTFYLFIPKSVDASSDERLFIPAIGLISRVKNISRTNNSLEVPDYDAGAYLPSSRKTVLIGHSSTVFKNLHQLRLQDELTFDSVNYQIKKIEILDKQTVDMQRIVADTSHKTLILMTCYGDPLGHQDYSHRLIITAEEKAQ